MTTNNSIKIPESFYTGFQTRSGSNIPLGFMTPDGTDSAATSRKDTVTRWSDSKIPAIVYENKPLSGFNVRQNIRHYSSWGQGNVKWRLEDPRGFEVEINSSNLAYILEKTTIENGEILTKCIWARDGKENYLVPVDSDLYQEAFKNTERVKKVISVKDVNPGDKIVLHNGSVCRYLGYFYKIDGLYKNLSISTKKKHFIEIQTDKSTSIDDLASLKIAEHEVGIPLSVQESLTLAKHATPSPTFKKFELEDDTGKSVDYKFKILDDDNIGIIGRYSLSPYYATKEKSVNILNRTDWDNCQFKYIQEQQRGYGYYGRDEMRNVSRQLPANEIFLQCKATVEDKTGTEYYIYF